MVQAWMQIPVEFRAIVGGLWGVLVATQLNRAIYRWAWTPHPIGPWSLPHPQAPPRRRVDRCPIAGWWFLRREASLHGAGYWIRPMLLEIGFGLAVGFLYLWLSDGGLLPLGAPRSSAAVIHAQFAALAILLGWITIATFIDIDEQTIPDGVTIPGALCGLLFAALLPYSRLPTWSPPDPVEPLLLAAPFDFPGWAMLHYGLLSGIAIYIAWWFAIWPKTITFRHGFGKALRYMGASMLRHKGFAWLFPLVPVGCVGIALVWMRGGLSWQSLLSALFGMAWSGGMVWGVRIVGSHALGREAMGFGDVTFMAMIGAYVGWQPATLVFFIAPFTGVVIALAQWLLTGHPAICYGPFLAAGLVLVVVYWPAIWGHYGAVFALGIVIPMIGLGCLILMGLMLMAWRRWAGSIAAGD